MVDRAVLNKAHIRTDDPGRAPFAENSHSPWSNGKGGECLEAGLKAGIFDSSRGEHSGSLSFLNGFAIAGDQNAPSSTHFAATDSQSPSSAPPPKMSEEDKAHINAELASAEQLSKGWDGSNSPSQNEVNSRLGNSQVGYWGDFHPDAKSVDNLNYALEKLKGAGVSTVAVEGLDQNGQNLARSWLAAPNGSKEATELGAKIRSYLKQAQPDGDNPSSETVKNNQTWRDKTFGLLQGIKATGLNVLGLEPNIESKSFDADRDQHWQGSVKAFLAEHPREKLLVFGGALHFTSADSFKANMVGNHINSVDLTPPSQYRQIRLSQ